MSDDAGGPAPRRGLGPRSRAIIAAGLLGMLAGFLWGVADVPRYSASATVIVSPKANRPGVTDPTKLDRFAELAASARVAIVAAGLLGGDVSGADLLSEVAVSPAATAGVLAIEASAEVPDFATAAANGYAQAIVKVAGKPLELGTAATLPGSPSRNRPALAWSFGGLALGLLAGALGFALLNLLRARAEPDAALSSGSAGPGPEPRADIGIELLGGFGDPALIVGRGSAGPALSGSAAAACGRLAEELGLAGADAPRTVAFADVGEGAGSAPVALGVAITAAGLGLRVLIVEAHLRDPSLAAMLGVEPEPGLHDYLLTRAGPREVLRGVEAHPDGGEPVPLLAVAAGARSADPPATLAGPRFEGLVERLPRVYDLVLFISPPLLDEGDAIDVTRAVDGVVLVTIDDERAEARIAEGAGMLVDGRLLAGAMTRPGEPQAAPQASR